MKKSILLFLFVFGLVSTQACKDFDFPEDIVYKSICESDEGECRCPSPTNCFCVSGACDFACTGKNCVVDCAQEMPNACLVDAPSTAVNFKCSKAATCEIEGGANSIVSCASSTACEVNLGENSQLSCSLGSCTGSVGTGSRIQPSANTAVTILCKGPDCKLTCNGLKCNIMCDSGPANQCDDTTWQCGPC